MIVINLIYYILVFLVGTISTFTPGNSALAKLLGVFLAGTSLYYIISNL